MWLLSGRWTKRTLLAEVAALEGDSEHPLAQAIVRSAKERGLPDVQMTDFESVPGHGAFAQVDGRRLAIGNVKMMAKEGADVASVQAQMDAAFQGRQDRDLCGRGRQIGRADRPGRQAQSHRRRSCGRPARTWGWTW